MLGSLLTVPNPSRVRLALWVQQAAMVPAEFRVLDAGAGGGPYRHLFDHCSYEAADFAQLDKAHTALDYVCDLTAIPVEDGRFDRILCNQVLEHVPDPVAVLTELRRVVKPGGDIWLSAPLFYEEHEQPYDFYRYTQFAWRDMAQRARLDVIEIDWLEGYYGTLSYQCAMAADRLPRRYAPIRIAAAVCGRWFAWRENRSKETSFGMPKNYTVVLRRPA